MQASKAKEQFRMMLAAAGFDAENPEPSVAWKTFKSFVRESVNCIDDGILFECGVFNFTGESLFYLEFVRQFSFDDDDAAGEYERMEQLHCTLTCLPTNELLPIQKNLWAYDFETLDEYFVTVENLREFQIAMAQSQWKFELKQEEV